MSLLEASLDQNIKVPAIAPKDGMQVVFPTVKELCDEEEEEEDDAPGPGVYSRRRWPRTLRKKK